MRVETVKSNNIEGVYKYDQNGDMVYAKEYNYDTEPCTVFERWMEYDDNHNEIYYKDSLSNEYTGSYKTEGNKIFYTRSTGYESVRELDNNGNEIYFKDNEDFECWSEYDDNGNLIHVKFSNGDEEWFEYDENNHCIRNYAKDRDDMFELDENGLIACNKSALDGFEIHYARNSNGDIISSVDSDGNEFYYEYTEE